MRLALLRGQELLAKAVYPSPSILFYASTAVGTVPRPERTPTAVSVPRGVHRASICGVLLSDFSALGPAAPLTPTSCVGRLLGRSYTSPEFVSCPLYRLAISSSSWQQQQQQSSSKTAPKPRAPIPDTQAHSETYTLQRAHSTHTHTHTHTHRPSQAGQGAGNTGQPRATGCATQETPAAVAAETARQRTWAWAPPIVQQAASSPEPRDIRHTTGRPSSCASLSAEQATRRQRPGSSQRRRRQGVGVR